VLDAAGRTASRREIRLGRQNPEVYEVLSGLAPGERVITSTYDAMEGAEELVLAQ
jgi:HlyD family secretion protein